MILDELQRILLIPIDSDMNISVLFFAAVAESQTFKPLAPWTSKFSVNTWALNSNSSVMLEVSFLLQTVCCPKQNKRGYLS